MVSALNSALVAESLADKVLNLLVEAIERGDLPPGSRIREAALARKLGISRGPLREALARLEGRRVLQYTPNLGMRVATVSLKDIIEIFQMREALEGVACKLAAQNMSDAELAELSALLEEHYSDSELREGSAYYQRAGDLDFHYRIALGSKNERLVEILCEDFYHFLRIHRFRSSASRGRASQAFNEHKAILQAMRDRDADKAEALMRQHIRTALQNLIESEPAPEPANAKAGATRRRFGSPLSLA
jgi:DNA-binding GntR family transcriptional regulator